MTTIGPGGPGHDDSSGLGLQVDYGTDSGVAKSSLSNVQMAAPIEVNPAYKGNLGRKNALMGNWRNPIGGQGTFFTQDDGAPVELPHSDQGSDYAKDRY
jgi:hypothetical protein